MFESEFLPRILGFRAAARVWRASVEKSHFLAALSEEGVLFTAAGRAAEEWRERPDGWHRSRSNLGLLEAEGSWNANTLMSKSKQSVSCCSCGSSTSSSTGLPVLLLDVSRVLASISQPFLGRIPSLHIYYGAPFPVDGSPC